MAKKKKSGGSNKSKYTSKNKYSLKVLKEMLSEMDKKVAAGEELTEYDEKLRDAIQKTMELIMNSRKLDLSVETERYLDQVLMIKGLELQKDGVDEDEIKSELASSATSYLLFEEINFLTATSAGADICYNAEESENLRIKANLKDSDDTVVYDPFEAMERAKDNCFVFLDIKPAEMGVKNADPDEVVRSLGVRLDAYREIFLHEMLGEL